MKQISDFQRFFILVNPKVIGLFILIGFNTILSYGQQAIPLQDFIEQTDKGSSKKIIGLLTEGSSSLTLNKKNIIADEDPYPQTLTTDFASLTLLKEPNAKFRSVKGIEIKISQVAEIGQLKLDPEALSQFPNLSYVLITSEVPLEVAQVDQMVVGFEPGDIVLLYQVSVLL